MRLVTAKEIFSWRNKSTCAYSWNISILYPEKIMMKTPRIRSLLYNFCEIENAKKYGVIIMKLLENNTTCRFCKKESIT